MRSLAWALFVATTVAGTSARAPSNHVIHVSTSEQLASALHHPLDNTTIRLAPGTYELTIDAGRDSLGILVSGRDVRLEGTDPDNTMILVHSARVSFKDCVDCLIDHVAITVGWLADGDGVIATANSSVQITNCVVRAGITGSRGALLTIEQNEVFARASGIELCDDAHALIRNNLVGDTVGSSLTAVQIRDDAQAVVERNHMLGTSGGILIRDDANVSARFNIIERMTSFGVAYVSRKIKPRATIESNVLYQCGGPAIMIDVRSGPTPNEAMGDVTRNIIVETGNRTLIGGYGGVIAGRIPGSFVVSRNTFYGNAAAADSLNRDVPREMFWRARRPWTRTYRNNPVGVDGRHKFYESAFLTRYGRWAD